MFPPDPDLSPRNRSSALSPIIPMSAQSALLQKGA